jgi:hypothetical protein
LEQEKTLSTKEQEDIKQFGYMFLRPDKIDKGFPIYHHFECNSGWHEMLFDLLKEVEKNDPLKIVRVLQIKEKFSTLRFYISFDHNEVPKENISDDYVKEIYNIIRIYEQVSAFICELCGHYGRTVSLNGWLRVLCKSCSVKKLNEN